jgi:pyruvate dehydrogenase E2 component (dihydrolipoamide acetyltransferase)
MLRTRRLDADQVVGTGAAGRITPADVTAADEPSTGRPGRAGLASPKVRRLLRDAGLRLTELAGSGPGGRVTREDAHRAIAGPGPVGRSDTPPVHLANGATGRSETVPLTPMRRTIADRMHRSLQTSAQLTAGVEVDLTRLSTRLHRAQPAFEQQTGRTLSPFVLIAAAVCEVLGRHPVLNARIDTGAGTATYVRDVHLGVAVDTERGPVVPTIPYAQELHVTGLTRRIAEVTTRAHQQDPVAEDASEATFTIADAGARGLLLETPILEPGQVATLATTLIEKRPVVVTDEFGTEAVAIRRRSYLCLTYDHRLVDGADAARFLADLGRRLEAGEMLTEFA